MRSRRSESLGILRNPTLMAMLGSVGFHGVLVLFSALHPADSQTNPLRIVSIAPQPVAPKGQPKGQGMGLPVPNSLPPINLGKVPELPASPDMSALKIPPSQSLYMPPSGGVGKLKIANPPVRSFVPPSLVNPGVGNVTPDGRPGNTGVLSPPNVPPENNGASPSPFTPSSRTKFDYSKYAPSKNPDLPKVNQGEFQQNSEGLYARSSPPDSSGTPSGTPSETAPVGNSSSEVRTQARTWLQAQEQRYGQKLSLQAAQPLTADYPVEACASQQQGLVRIAALYGPDGTLVSREVIESATSPSLDQAAIAEVTRFRPEAANIYQAFNFTVRIPYSTKVCAATQPKSPPTPTSSPEASDRPTSNPQPSQSQPSSNPVPQPTFSPTNPLPEPKRIAPAEPIPPDRVQPPSQAPEPSAAPNPASSGAADSPERSFSSPGSGGSSLEPLPNPSIDPGTSNP
jgi:TonB family protein